MLYSMKVRYADWTLDKATRFYTIYNIHMLSSFGANDSNSNDITSK